MAEQMTQLTIPSRINVGFKKRDDTYTTKLGYVIYFDHKGKLRKQKSWEGWRDPKMPPVELLNEPTEGFVLNRDVGGARRSYGWDVRIEKVRVYDPRDWEFEIDIPNLLFILKECDCSRGKGLEGKFVYAWRGQELVLLPVSSQEYQSSASYTELQTKGVKAKELIAGASYTTKKQQVLTYLGRFDYYAVQAGYRPEPPHSLKYVFWDGKHFQFMDTPKQIALLNSDTVTPELAELVDKYHKGVSGTKPVRLFLKDQRRIRPAKGRAVRYFAEDTETASPTERPAFIMYEAQYDYHKPLVISHISSSCKVYLKDDAIRCDNHHSTAYPKGTRRDPWYERNNPQGNWVEPTGKQLWVELESGSQFQFGGTYEKLIDPSEKEASNGEEDYDDDN